MIPPLFILSLCKMSMESSLVKKKVFLWKISTLFYMKKYHFMTLFQKECRTISWLSIRQNFYAFWFKTIENVIKGKKKLYRYVKSFHIVWIKRLSNWNWNWDRIINYLLFLILKISIFYISRLDIGSEIVVDWNRWKFGTNPRSNLSWSLICLIENPSEKSPQFVDSINHKFSLFDGTTTSNNINFIIFFCSVSLEPKWKW
jgi:hypothetical protein